MIINIGLKNIPNNTFTCVLDNQYCTIKLYQRSKWMFLDLYVDNTQICAGAICEHGVDVIQSKSTNFHGSLHFLDIIGQHRPMYELLGVQYALIFVSEDEIDLPDVLLN